MNEEQIRQRNGGYLHAEAYALMEYASEDGREVEYIWNSRDGVTSFCVMSRRGTELRHAHWNRDRRIPDFVPQPGSRIFVDATPERMRPLMERRVQEGWNHPRYPLKDMFETQDEAVEHLVNEVQPGEPYVQVVE